MLPVLDCTLTPPLPSPSPRFDYLHKKQSGGAGQYGRIIGELQPMTNDQLTQLEFVDGTVGMNIPKSFIPGIEKGFLEVCEKGGYTPVRPLPLMAVPPSGLLTGHRVVGLRMVLKDGVSHAVDSSEMAFKLAAMGAVRQGTWCVCSEARYLVGVCSEARYLVCVCVCVVRQCTLVALVCVCSWSRCTCKTGTPIEALNSPNL